MTQMPPPQNYPPQQPPPGQPPAGSQTNGVAIGSLICGILGCIPVITSVAAVILGVVGIKKAKPPVGGKGFAIAGIILGLIGLAGWGGMGAVTYWGYGYAKKMIAATENVSNGFFGNLVKGDIAAASQYSTGNISQAELQTLGEQVKTLGEFKNFSLNDFKADASNPKSLRLNVAGTADFANGTKQFRAVFVGNMDDGFKVDDMSLE